MEEKFTNKASNKRQQKTENIKYNISPERVTLGAT